MYLTLGYALRLTARKAGLTYGEMQARIRLRAQGAVLMGIVAADPNDMIPHPDININLN